MNTIAMFTMGFYLLRQTCIFGFTWTLEKIIRSAQWLLFEGGHPSTNPDRQGLTSDLVYTNPHFADLS